MPVVKCSNGKWRVGSGACIYDTKEKAIKVYQAILAQGKLAKEKISLDYDGVVSTEKGKQKLQELIDNGADVYIISARRSKDEMANVGLPASKIFAVGSNKQKIEKIKELNIEVHYDDNPDVVNELSKLNIKSVKW